MNKINVFDFSDHCVEFDSTAFLSLVSALNSDSDLSVIEHMIKLDPDYVVRILFDSSSRIVEFELGYASDSEWILEPDMFIGGDVFG